MPPHAYMPFRPHPWHGLDAGPESPSVVNAFIEITPFDSIKYEVDKTTGYLKVDRPQRGASSPPTLYGFIPRTWCDERVAKLSPGALRGDGDPLDICVISERPIARSEVILSARVVGGLRMIDGGEADDKIVAVLVSDAIWSPGAGARRPPAGARGPAPALFRDLQAEHVRPEQLVDALRSFPVGGVAAK